MKIVACQRLKACPVGRRYPVLFFETTLCLFATVLTSCHKFAISTPPTSSAGTTAGTAPTPPTTAGQVKVRVAVGAALGTGIGGAVGGSKGAAIGAVIGAAGGAALSVVGRGLGKAYNKITTSGQKSGKSQPVPPPPAPPPPSIPPFPWPPPTASATEVLPRDLLEGHSHPRSLGDLNAILVSALNKNGYSEKSYYAVPGGFALATRLEQIKPDGVSKSPPDRWSSDTPQSHGFDLIAYIRALFTANPAFYRVIVFIVTEVPFTQKPGDVSPSQARIWTTQGGNILPQEIANELYTPRLACTALIYEFKRDQGEDPKMLLPSHLDAHTHLIKSGLWQALKESP